MLELITTASDGAPTTRLYWQNAQRAARRKQCPLILLHLRPLHLVSTYGLSALPLGWSSNAPGLNIGATGAVSISTRSTGYARLMRQDHLRVSPIVLVILGVVLPALQFAVYGVEHAHPALILHCLMTPVLALPIAYLSRTQRYLELSTYLFAYVFFGLASTAQLMVGQFPLRGSYGIGDVLWADAIVLVGLLCFAIGASKGGTRTFDWAMRPLTVKRLWIGSFLAVCLFVAAVLYFETGLTMLFLSRNESIEALMLATGTRDSLVQFQVASSLMRVPVLVASTAVLAFAVIRRRLRWLAVVLVVANLIINNPVSTARFVVGTYAIAYLIIIGSHYFPQSLGRTYALLMPFIFAVLFPMIDVFRHSSDNISIAGADVFEVFATKGDFDSFQLVMDAGRLVADRGVALGLQFIGSLGFFVPRAIWSGKPEPTGIVLGDWGGRENVNLAAPLWIEFYIDWWWLGVIFGMGALGFFCRRIEKGLASTGDVNISTITVPLLAGYLMILLRGSLMTAMSFLLPIMFFLLVFSVTSKVKFTLKRFVP